LKKVIKKLFRKRLKAGIYNAWISSEILVFDGKKWVSRFDYTFFVATDLEAF